MENRETQADSYALMGNDVTKEAFERFLERVPGGVFRYKASNPDTVDFISKGMLDLMGCENRQQFDVITGGCFSGMVHPDDRQATIESINEQISHGDTDGVVYRLNRADGKEVWVDDRGRAVTDSSGQRWFYVTALDVTPQIERDKELKRARERMDILTALSNDIVFDIECETGEAEIFGDFEDRFSREPRQEDFIVKRRCHKDCKLNLHAKGLSELYNEINENSLVDFETSTEGPDGEPIWYRYQSVVLYDDNGNAVRHVGRLLDTHDMIMRESQFRKRAEHDGLTGLYNRAAALNRIEPLLHDGKKPFTFILVDVDDFKSVNDTFGHPEGDRVLREIASFLESTMRQEDILVRLGGDEFAVFAKGLGRGPALERIVERLSLGPFVDSLSVDDDGKRRASPSLSLGVIYGNGEPTSFDEVYAQADAALYEAKQRGKAQASVKMLS